MYIMYNNYLYLFWILDDRMGNSLIYMSRNSTLRDLSLHYSVFFFISVKFHLEKFKESNNGI